MRLPTQVFCSSAASCFRIIFCSAPSCLCSIMKSCQDVSTLARSIFPSPSLSSRPTASRFLSAASFMRFSMVTWRHAMTVAPMVALAKAATDLAALAKVLSRSMRFLSSCLPFSMTYTHSLHAMRLTPSSPLPTKCAKSLLLAAFFSLLCSQSFDQALKTFAHSMKSLPWATIPSTREFESFCVLAYFLSRVSFSHAWTLIARTALSPLAIQRIIFSVPDCFLRASSRIRNHPCTTLVWMTFDSLLNKSCMAWRFPSLSLSCLSRAFLSVLSRTMMMYQSRNEVDSVSCSSPCTMAFSDLPMNWDSRFFFDFAAASRMAHLLQEPRQAETAMLSRPEIMRVIAFATAALCLSLAACLSRVFRSVFASPCQQAKVVISSAEPWPEMRPMSVFLCFSRASFVSLDAPDHAL
mmetsp:Transcript_101433/g.310166  ORF Transcript_101433/g.310166 Transcript_101433/m.310166 type:complete len:409 (+) Transcript_101433:375-1601(+)